MSLPSWLKRALNNPFETEIEPIPPYVPPAFPAVVQEPFNGYPGGLPQLHRDLLARQVAMGVMNTGASPAPPRYRARTLALDVLSTEIARKIISAMPPTAAVKIQGVTVVHGGGPPEVEVSFYGRDGHEPFILPLTDEFPSDADISRILLAMP